MHALALFIVSAVDLTDVKPEQTSTVVQALNSAVVNKWWGMAAAAVLSLLLMGLRLALPNLSKFWVNVSSALIATLPSVIVVLNKPSIDPAEVIGTAIQSVVMAAGLWHLVFKGMGGGAAIEARAAAKDLPGGEPHPPKDQPQPTEPTQ